MNEQIKQVQRKKEMQYCVMSAYDGGLNVDVAFQSLVFIVTMVYIVMIPPIFIRNKHNKFGVRVTNKQRQGNAVTHSKRYSFHNWEKNKKSMKQEQSFQRNA